MNERRSRLAGDDLKCVMSFSENINRRGGIHGVDESLFVSGADDMAWIGVERNRDIIVG